MTNYQIASLMLLASPIAAKIVSEFYADKPVAWEWTKIVLIVIGLWIVFGGGVHVIVRMINY